MKKFVWNLLLPIGLIPLAAPFFYYFLLCFAHGGTRLSLTDVLVLWSVLHWPTYLVGLALCLLSLCRRRG